MISFKRKANITLQEIHTYVDDITRMQDQRDRALKLQNIEEVRQLEHNIQIALEVQERLLERVAE